MVTQALMEVDGQKLRRLRNHRVWLTGDLAREGGVHRNVVSKLENARGGAYPETIRSSPKPWALIPPNS